MNKENGEEGRLIDCEVQFSCTKYSSPAIDAIANNLLYEYDGFLATLEEMMNIQ